MKKLIILIVLVLVIIVVLEKKPNTMIDVTKMNTVQIEKYAKNNKLRLKKIEEYNEKEKGTVLKQSIKPGEKTKSNQILKITVSKGKIDYQKYKVNELGTVPIMMYHGIVNKKDSDTQYTKGNVDKDGYHRTTESFIRDLEFYYQNNYRMIRLTDYIDGNIDVELGKSPIILTFDDGLENNIKVTGLDKNGEIIIDENSAVGILEKFKKKYKDYNVTATFFVNGSLFNQTEYNEKILEWLIKHNYDIGNHTNTHVDFKKISIEKTEEEVGIVYQKLDKIIKGKYINVVALPFGSPYKKDHDNFSYILKGEYQNIEYITKSTLRVGWEAEESPFSKNFDKTFLKRIRAYDNNGKDFDIQMNFEILEQNKYISDGNKNEVTVEKTNVKNLNTNKKVITY